MKLRTRVIVAGSRDFEDYSKLAITLVRYFIEKDLKPCDVEIISGYADGADKLGEKFANKLIDEGIKLTILKADWDRRGDSAGYIRNLEMAKYANSYGMGVCFVFWNGVSKGTKSMIEIAKREGLELHIIKY